MSVKSIQAPVGGLNRFSSLDDMPESDAYYLDNWIPDTGDCRVREGCQLMANYGTDEIGTLIPFGDKFIVCTDGDVKDSGFTPVAGGLPTVGASSDIGTLFTEDRWQWTVFNDKLLMVNGADAPQQYDGTTLSAISFTSGITTEAELIGVGSFKGRAIYWKADEAGFYYAAANSYQGAMNYFDLSPQVSRKAYLKLFFTWSADSGDGPDDYAVFVFDSGEAVVYQGSDPGDIDFWALVGRYEMGEPLSIRSGVPIAGDHLILTRTGWVNFLSIWQTDNTRDAGIGQKITGLSTDAAADFGSQTGWEAHFYPELRQVIINVPNGSDTYVQHALNTNTGAWSTFSGWESATFGEFKGQPYYGDSSGNVYVALYGNDDNGSPIITDALPAFSYLGSRAGNKQLTGIRPVISVADSRQLELEPCADFLIQDSPTIGFTPVAPSSSPWGSPWGSPWSQAAASEMDGSWKTANAYGYALTYRMATTSNGRPVRWTSTNVLYRQAGWL